ncbi:MAG: hypothetical protein M3Q60_16180 [Actinomycetota bacterium]|nr:hypothetical protein [Actinomycetota bacterium]
MRLLGGRWVLLLGLVALGGVLLAVPGVRRLLTELLDVVSRGDGAAIRDAVRGYGSLAPAASIALILLHAVIPLRVSGSASGRRCRRRASVGRCSALARISSQRNEPNPLRKLFGKVT